MAAPCESCSTGGLEMDGLLRWPKVVALVWTGEPIPRNVLTAKGPIRVYRAKDVALPNAMWRRLPQAAVVDPQCCIIAVPAASQSLKEFLESP